MKRNFIWIVFSLALAAFGGYQLWNYSATDERVLRIPGGSNEENKARRKAWERQMLADPATGQIPPGMTYIGLREAARMPRANADNSVVWNNRGPWNVGGRTRALAMDINDENHLFAGGVSGGIWESTDGGQSWTRRTPLNAHPGVVSISQDRRPGHTNTWYYLSGEIYGTSASGGGSFYLGDGMFKSTDNGHTWSAIGSTDDGNPQAFTNVWQSGWRVVTDPAAPEGQDIVYAATYGAIWRSINGGSSWSAVRGGPNANPASYFTDVAITSTGVLYAAMSSESDQWGLWRSINGTTWTKINPDTTAAGGFPKVFERFVIGVNPNNENEVYFLGSTPGYGHYNEYITSDDWCSLWKYTYVSGDGSGSGGQWVDLSGNLPSTGTEFDQFAAQGGYDLVVKVQPGTGHVFAGGTNLWRSTDGFSTPNNTTHIGGYKPGTYLPFFELYPNHHPDQHDLLFLPSSPNVMITASDGGLHRTEDCNAANVVWSYLNNGYQTSQFYTAIFDKSTANDPMIIGGLQDNGNFFVNSNDQTAIWKQTVNGDGSYGAIPDGKPYVILSIQLGRLAKCSIDDDGNVLAFRRFDPIGPTDDDYLFINPLVLDPVDQNILYLPAGKKLYRQNDLDAIELTGQWDSIAQGWTVFPDSVPGTNAVITAIACSKGAPQHRLYFGTNTGRMYRIDNAHTGLPAFTALPSPLASNSAYVNSIAIDPENADKVLMTYSNYGIYSLYYSENAGQTWQKVGGNLEANLSGTTGGFSVRSVAILKLDDNGGRKYICGTSLGLYSADSLKLHATGQAGTQWVQEGADVIGNSVVPFVDVRQVDGLVVAATHGVGLFTANYAVSTGVKDKNKNFVVKTGPNPASRYFNIDLTETKGTAIQLNMYNLNGQLVVSRTLQGGKSTAIDVSGLPNGAYVWSLSGPDKRHSGKLMVGR